MAAIDLSVAGAGAGDTKADTVIVNGTDRPDSIGVDARGTTVDVSVLAADTFITGSERTDRLQLNTLGDDDRVNVADDATRLIGVAVELGRANEPQAATGEGAGNRRGRLHRPAARPERYTLGMISPQLTTHVGRDRSERNGLRPN